MRVDASPLLRRFAGWRWVHRRPQAWRDDEADGLEELGTGVLALAPLCIGVRERGAMTHTRTEPRRSP